MKKPKTRTKFASPEEQQEHVLNCLCWRYAEKMALELALSEDDQEKLADAFKDILYNRRLFFEAAEAAEEGDRLQ